MKRQHKQEARRTRLEQTRVAILAAIKPLLIAEETLLGKAVWHVHFGPPHCSSRGPSRHEERKRGIRMHHTITVPEDWLEMVQGRGMAVADGYLILAAALAYTGDLPCVAWRVVYVTQQGRKLRPCEGFLVRWGGDEQLAESIRTGWDAIQNRLRVGLGLAERELPF